MSTDVDADPDAITDIETAGLAGAVHGLVRAARVLERAADELNLAHFRVLSAIADGEARASKVAARLALGRPAISSAVAALTDRGLLSQGTSATDQRAVELRLTPAGRAVLAACERTLDDRLLDLARLTPNPTALLAALDSLNAAVDRFHAGQSHAGQPAGPAEAAAP
ncbi:MarR family winged helix-turn-helix transcriptional regulator [Specibacter cremeus]|uniref:MarR family winged helix-turn-helix transcriptional regulator n=1 Tax=Specibacter cremeus TaxID=1629051 RepID=UPI000F7693F4|nr:MarR family winged helix-turn-helix transcriptional regulator [Specibacter cremeus]